MSSDIFSSRINKLRQTLLSQGLDGIYLTNLTSVRYISGFTGSAGSCLITENDSYFISDGRYDVQSEKQVNNMIRYIDFGNHISIIEKNKLIKDGQNLAFEGDHTSFSQYKAIVDSFPKVEWKSTSMIMENLQAVKDESELSAIRTAVEITDMIYEEILPMLKPGTTEKEVANQLVLRYRQESDGEAYNPIVAGGENGALPHAVPSERPFKDGDFIVIDAAAKYAGYHADMTRTVATKGNSEQQKDIYNIVLEAQLKSIEGIKPGVSCKAIDSIARTYITDAGYGKYFDHGLGHSLGLEIHEDPRFSKISKDTLKSNYVMTVEPGIYLEAVGGVRIEDDVVVTDDGYEVLNKTSKDFTVIS